MTAPAEAKRTPLYDLHCQLGARMVHFGGWDMPVSYSSILEEHARVRTHAGLFDVSHMGEILIHGPGAAAALQYVTVNDVSVLADLQLQYSALCNEAGGILDDLTVCRLAADRFLLIVNAANSARDFAWITQHLGAGAQAEEVSEAYALLALQGPAAEAIVQRVSPVALDTLGYYWALRTSLGGIETLVSRTGYTGEDGFELLVDATQAVRLWQLLSEAGQADGLVPVGLGARDTLRLEARYLLYGQDMDESTTPLEVGLGWITKFAKGPFLGREALLRMQAQGVPRRLLGFVMQERGIPRPHYPVLSDDRPIGAVTSGTLSPTLGQAIGTALVQRTAVSIGSPIAIEIRHRPVAARIVPAPFVPRHVKR
ncbi:MAG: glycine cleavage system aminomethyltransferase GcvT [Candidatus Tectimicrobiota bacterium]